MAGGALTPGGTKALGACVLLGLAWVTHQQVQSGLLADFRFRRAAQCTAARGFTLGFVLCLAVTSTSDPVTIAGTIALSDAVIGSTLLLWVSTAYKPRSAFHISQSRGSILREVWQNALPGWTAEVCTTSMGWVCLWLLTSVY